MSTLDRARAGRNVLAPFLIVTVGVAAHAPVWGQAVPTRPAAPAGAAAFTNSIGMRFKLIPKGAFSMGSPAEDKQALGDEKPRHRVTIKRPFYLGVTEVTRGQFRRFVADAGYQTEAEKDGQGGHGWNKQTGKFELNPKYSWRNAGFDQTDDHPVVNVTWNDAVALAAWLSQKEGRTYRLPTEAEWEYACRAGTNSSYSFGNDAEGLAAVGNVYDATAKPKLKMPWDSIAASDGFVFTAPVGHYPANAWGLYDMHGNVWEWCADWYDKNYYKSSPAVDPAGPSRASVRVLRGGCFVYGPRYGRSAVRFTFAPALREGDMGFRLALVQSVR